VSLLASISSLNEELRGERFGLLTFLEGDVGEVGEVFASHGER
jgi:hypothetical protein